VTIYLHRGVAFPLRRVEQFHDSAQC
jgi:hypothetical protein